MTRVQIPSRCVCERGVWSKANIHTGDKTMEEILLIQLEILLIQPTGGLGF